MEIRFQFSVKNLFGAIFWLSMTLGSFTLLMQLRPRDFEGWPDWLVLAVMMSLGLLLIVSPCIALLELFGRPRAGARVGLTIALIACTVLALALLPIIVQ